MLQLIVAYEICKGFVCNCAAGTHLPLPDRLACTVYVAYSRADLHLAVTETTVAEVTVTSTAAIAIRNNTCNTDATLTFCIAPTC
jgi:hypothetical protein